MYEARGMLLLIIQGLLLLPTGEALLYHPVEIQIEGTFARTILPCGLRLKAQESHLATIWIFLIELTKDSEKVLLTLKDFVIMGLLLEDGIRQEILKVTGCAIQGL